MATKVVTAKSGKLKDAEGKMIQLVRKDVEIYDMDSEVDELMLKRANQGVTLDNQRDMVRKALIKHGITTATSNGKEVSLEDAEEI